MKKAVMYIVGDRSVADVIVGQLQSAGFANSDISVLFPDKDGARDFAHVHHTKVPEGAIAGGGPRTRGRSAWKSRSRHLAGTRRAPRITSARSSSTRRFTASGSPSACGPSCT